MSKLIFWSWVIYGISQGVIILYMIIDTFEGQTSNLDGRTSSFWVLGILVYCCVVIIANVEVMFQSNVHTVHSFIFQIISILLFFLMYYIENLINKIDEVFQTFTYIWSTPVFFIVIFFVIGIVVIYKKIVFYGAKLTDLYKEIKMRKKLIKEGLHHTYTVKPFHDTQK